MPIMRLVVSAVAAWMIGHSPARSEPAGQTMSEPEILSFLEAEMPEILETVAKSRVAEPEAHERWLAELGRHIQAYLRIRVESPELAETLLHLQRLQWKSLSLAKQIAATKPAAEREALIADLRYTLEESFDLELREPESEVDELEMEVLRLRRIIEERKQGREEIIADRLRSLIGLENGAKP